MGNPFDAEESTPAARAPSERPDSPNVYDSAAMDFRHSQRLSADRIGERLIHLLVVSCSWQSPALGSLLAVFLSFSAAFLSFYDYNIR